MSLFEKHLLIIQSEAFHLDRFI